jgi:hypothetical protein
MYRSRVASSNVNQILSILTLEHVAAHASKTGDQATAPWGPEYEDSGKTQVSK